jgi:pyridoxamine 5'-phosphate oxidase
MNLMTEKITSLRREYISKPFSEDSVALNPIDQFKYWFTEALESEQPDTEAMTLSTTTREGRLSSRIVLLRGVDERGFVFFTNYESRKARELTAHPTAALTFYWFTLNRQVRVEGSVSRVMRQESEDYFKTRPRGSQLGAWASPQSDEITSREALNQKLAEVELRFKDQPIPCPPFWGGFCVHPTVIEFWQGRENRLHDRILYTLIDGQWRISRLAP